MSLVTIWPASGERLGSQECLQAPGNEFLSKISEFLGFLNFAHFGLMRLTLSSPGIFQYSMGGHEILRGTSAGTQTVSTPKLAKNEFMDPENSSNT